MVDKGLLDITLNDLFRRYPYASDFFDSMALAQPELALHGSITILEYLTRLDPVYLEDRGLSSEALPEDFLLFLANMEDRHSQGSFTLESLTVIGGCDKDGNKEDFGITLRPADILSVVGPTGSGKSRLLADIEWLAQGDTPTKRVVLVNGDVPPAHWRYSLQHKIVAQLSQNMNFVMDVSVADFIRMHAASRLIDDVEGKVGLILAEANRLAGEPLSPQTPVTSLSGGQSRALMIADVAHLSTSPVVLIDEIENAGINRQAAVDLLIMNEKIVIIATHDPSLALRADRRLVIKNGSVVKTLETSAAERERLVEIEAIDQRLMDYRERLRNGETV